MLPVRIKVPIFYILFADSLERLPEIGCVNNNRLVMTGDQSSPDTSFPFPRIATLSTTLGLEYVYHQFDNFTLFEDVFNQNISAWTSSTDSTGGGLYTP